MNFLKSIKRKTIVWFLANFLNYPYWVVSCDSGTNIMFLKRKDAKKVKKKYNGKMKINYNINLPNKFNKFI